MLEFPDLKKRLKMSDNQGRPRLEENHEGILEAILELATHGCAADERRSTDKLRTIKSIDELNAELKKWVLILAEVHSILVFYLGIQIHQKGNATSRQYQ